MGLHFFTFSMNHACCGTRLYSIQAIFTYFIIYIYTQLYKWANALVPPTPFQGWRKKCADIEPLKKPSKRLGLNIVKHTYVYIYSTLHAFHSQKWNDDRNWGILMTSLWRRHQDERLWNTPRHPRPSNAHVSCWDRCSYAGFICAKGC